MRAPNRQLHVAHFKQRDGIGLDTRCYFTAASRTSVLQHDATSTSHDPKRGPTHCIRRERLSTALCTHVWLRCRLPVAAQQTWRARRNVNQGLSSNFSAAAHTTPVMPTFFVTTRQLWTTDHTTQITMIWIETIQIINMIDSNTLEHDVSENRFALSRHHALAHRRQLHRKGRQSARRFPLSDRSASPHTLLRVCSR